MIPTVKQGVVILKVDTEEKCYEGAVYYFYS